MDVSGARIPVQHIGRIDARDFAAIDPRDEAVVVFHPQRQEREIRWIPDQERQAKKGRRIDVEHVGLEIEADVRRRYTALAVVNLRDLRGRKLAVVNAEIVHLPVEPAPERIVAAAQLDFLRGAPRPGGGVVLLPGERAVDVNRDKSGGRLVIHVGDVMPAIVIDGVGRGELIDAAGGAVARLNEHATVVLHHDDIPRADISVSATVEQNWPVLAWTRRGGGADPKTDCPARGIEVGIRGERDLVAGNGVELHHPAARDGYGRGVGRGGRPGRAHVHAIVRCAGRFGIDDDVG